MTNFARATQAEYGRMREISRQRVNQLVKDGRIPLDESGLVIVDQADANLAAMLDQRRANRDRQMALARGAFPSPDTRPIPVAGPERMGSGAELDEGRASGGSEIPAAAKPEIRPDAEARMSTEPTAAADYWAHKARREAAAAQLEELRLQERLGALVEAEEVRRSRRETATRLTSALLQLPAQLAPVVATMSDSQACERLMAERIHKVLHELATDLEAAPPEREEPRAA